MNSVEHPCPRMLFRQLSHLLGWTVNRTAKLLLHREAYETREQLRELYYQHRNAIKSDVPSILVDALLECEDHRFHSHRGVDPFATIRALIKTLSGCGIQGGSTVEQQFIRTITNRREKTIRRKIREICLATLVEDVIPKEEIPALYLLVAYYGWRMNGLLEAYRRLNLQPKSLSSHDAAAIVARLKYPEPKNAPAWRVNQICQRKEHIIQLLQLRRRHGSERGKHDFV